MSNKIKLLHIIGPLGVGGCEKQLLELCRRLDKSKFELSLIWYSFMPGFKDTALEMDSTFNKAGIRTIHFDKFSIPWWQFIIRLRSAIKSISPDIVQTWMYSANFWGRWVALFCGVPHLIASYRVEVTKTTENHLVARVSEKLLSKRCIRAANSSAVAQSLEKYYGIPQNEVKIIYNAIDMEPVVFKAARVDIRKRLGLPLEQKIVLMVASQKMQKNHPLFIRTARHVCHNRHDVTFIGVGRKDRENELDTLIAQHNLQGKILFPGQQDDIQQWLAAADIFCFTSDYEGFPNAVLEAMMAGLPVVTTNFHGIEELISNDVTGCIVPLNDDKAMALKITELLEHPEISINLGAAAKDAVMSRFDWNTLLKTMEELYTELC